MQLQHVRRARSSVITQAAASQHDGSVMETMIVETGLMKGTAAYPLPHRVNTITDHLTLCTGLYRQHGLLLLFV